MKRLSFMIGALLLVLTVKAQVVNYTYRYWLDQNAGQTTVLVSNNSTWQMDLDVGELSPGLHQLYLQVRDTTGIWSSPENYTFFKVTVNTPLNTTDVVCHYWFDQDVDNKQIMPFGTGVFTLNADQLSTGLHLLYVLLEGNGLTSTNCYLFYKAKIETPLSPSTVTYRCWFDQDYEHAQTGDLATSGFLLDASGLSSGLHLLYVALEGKGLTSSESYMFYKVPEEVPVAEGDLKIHYWFDDDSNNLLSATNASGMFMLDATQLDEGPHEVHFVIQKTALTTIQNYSFNKIIGNHFIVAGNWSDASNWQDLVVPDASSTAVIDAQCQLDTDAEVTWLAITVGNRLTIPSGKTLTVSEQVNSHNPAGLTLQEGAQLYHNSANAKATVEKQVLAYNASEGQGWNLLASPLASAVGVASVGNLLSNNYDLYYYDEPSQYWKNQKNTANNFIELVGGNGYLYANSSDVDLEFAGSLQSGSAKVNIPLSYTEGIAFAGCNLVGNPFVHNITSYETENVANGCYRINETRDDFMVSEVNATHPLKPGEGFFVIATAEAASITFNTGRGAKASESGSVWMDVTENDKVVDRLIVKKEGQFLEKLSLNDERTKLFALQDHQEMAIVPMEGHEQVVCFKAAKNGSYTLRMQADLLDLDYLHLVDNLTGADIDLLKVPSYTFSAKTSDYASRFKLVYSGNNSGDEPFAFISNGELLVKGDGLVQVIDLMGRILHQGDASCPVSIVGMTPGIYMLRLHNKHTVKTQKIIIK